MLHHCLTHGRQLLISHCLFQPVGCYPSWVCYRDLALMLGFVVCVFGDALFSLGQMHHQLCWYPLAIWQDPSIHGLRAISSSVWASLNLLPSPSIRSAVPFGLGDLWDTQEEDPPLGLIPVVNSL